MRAIAVLLLTLALAGMTAVRVQAESMPGRRDSGWSGTGVAELVRQLSESLGAIHAGAQICGLSDEAQAVAEKHREHLERLESQGVQIDPDWLRDIFLETAESYRTAPGYTCGERQRQEIRRNLPDVFASIEAFHAALAARP